MKESISYSFLLNIIILFIFVCVAIVMGIFSYYRAFRANTIIISAIEKYEGYNCLSALEAEQKLIGINYNVPFDVNCKSSYGSPCMSDANNNYAVVSYNLDKDTGDYKTINDDHENYYLMNSQYSCSGSNDCTNTKQYQYGVYTYMYVDLPVVSSLIRIPFFSKTRQLYEYRDFYLHEEGKRVYDSRFIPNNYLEIASEFLLVSEFNNYCKSAFECFAKVIQNHYANEISGLSGLSGTIFSSEYNARLTAQYIDGDISSGMTVLNGYNFSCGTSIDYSKY